MGEQEWLTCKTPQPMLDFLGFRDNERKLRLFAVACCRRIWDVLISKGSRRAVEVCERFADGMASRKELRYAYSGASKSCDRACYRAHPPDEIVVAAAAAAKTSARGVNMSVFLGGICSNAARASGQRETEALVQVGFLREIFGNPFRPVTFGEGTATWNGGLIARMASQIYDTQEYADLPILADALEDVGCMSQDLLDHCRTSGGHLRGCWVVDLILGKSDEAMRMRYLEYEG